MESYDVSSCSNGKPCTLGGADRLSLVGSTPGAEVFENTASNLIFVQGKSNDDKPITRQLTEQEIQDHLEGFIQVPSDQWKFIPPGSQVSYITTERRFFKGGFLKKIFHVEGVLHFQLENKKHSRGAGQMEWPINSVQIRTLYKKQPSLIEPELNLIRAELKSLREGTAALRTDLETETKLRLRLEQQNEDLRSAVARLTKAVKGLLAKR